MHILILYQHYLSPGEPGFSRLNEYAKRWVRDGFEVTVIASQVNYMTGRRNVPSGRSFIRRYLDEEGVRLIRAYTPSSYQHSVSNKIAALATFTLSSTLATLWAKRPDVILASTPPLMMVIPAILAASWWRVPFVLDIRDLWPESGYTLGILKEGGFFARLFSWLEKTGISRAAAVNVLTPAFEDDLLRRGLAPPQKIRLIPNGVDLEQIAALPPAEGIREKLGWKDRFVVLYAGAHGLANNLEQLVEAASILSSHPEVLLACVGDGIALPELKRKAQEKGLANIRFHGPVPRGTVLEFVAAADICVAILKPGSAFSKVYPNKILEYMACGKPILLAIDGAARQLVEEAGAGIFVPPADPGAIARGILTLMASPEMRASMGRRGREFVTRHFSLDRLYAQMTDLLRAVAEKRGKGWQSGYW